MNRRYWLLAAAAFTLSGCASMYPAQSVTDILAREPDLSTLNKLVKDAGLSSTLNGAGPFTVFAPTNAAFSKVPSKTMDELAKDPKRLQAVLSYHLLPGKTMAKDVKPGNAKTLEGASVALGSTAGYVSVDAALVTRADMTAANGVVHEIDAVLMPPKR